MKNYYKIFEVNNEADSKEIRKAYLKKIKESHPDTNANFKKGKNPDLNELKHAYNILKDPVERYFYDLRLEQERKNQHIFHDSIAFTNDNIFYGRKEGYDFKYKWVLIVLWIIIGFLISLTISVYLTYKDGSLTTIGEEQNKRPSQPQEQVPMNYDRYIKEI